LAVPAGLTQLCGGCADRTRAGSRPRPRLSKPLPYHSANPPGGRPRDVRRRAAPGLPLRAARRSEVMVTPAPAPGCPDGNSTDSDSRSSSRSSPGLWNSCRPVPHRQLCLGRTFDATHFFRAAPKVRDQQSDQRCLLRRLRSFRLRARSSIRPSILTMSSDIWPSRTLMAPTTWCVASSRRSRTVEPVRQPRTPRRHGFQLPSRILNNEPINGQLRVQLSAHAATPAHRTGVAAFEMRRESDGLPLTPRRRASACAASGPRTRWRAP
jgi:hypothetical protein